TAPHTLSLHDALPISPLSVTHSIIIHSPRNVKPFGGKIRVNEPHPPVRRPFPARFQAAGPRSEPEPAGLRPVAPVGGQHIRGLRSEEHTSELQSRFDL